MITIVVFMDNSLRNDTPPILRLRVHQNFPELVAFLLLLMLYARCVTMNASIHNWVQFLHNQSEEILLQTAELKVLNFVVSGSNLTYSIVPFTETEE